MLPGHGFSNWIPHLHSSLLFCFELVKRRQAQCFFNLIFTWQIFLSLHLSKFTDKTWKETRTSSNGNAKGMPSVSFKCWQISEGVTTIAGNSGLSGRVTLCNTLGNQSKIDKNVCSSLSSPHSSPLPLAFFFSLWYSRLLWKLPFRWSYDDSFLPHKFPSLTSCVFLSWSRHPHCMKPYCSWQSLS